MLRTGDDFINNNILQLFYHDNMVNARNGHYETNHFLQCLIKNRPKHVTTNKTYQPTNNNVH